MTISADIAAVAGVLLSAFGLVRAWAYLRGFI